MGKNRQNQPCRGRRFNVLGRSDKKRLYSLSEGGYELLAQLNGERRWGKKEMEGVGVVDHCCRK